MTDRLITKRPPMREAKSVGVFRKFKVTRTDGSSARGGKHHDCEYFVLDVDHDMHAKAALTAYANTCEAALPLLALDMRLRYGLPGRRDPIDMVLHCPACGLQHIDAPEPDLGPSVDGSGDMPLWTNPPHRSHLCAGCGHVWRPADVPTNGVQAVKTKGKADSPIMVPRLAQYASYEAPSIATDHDGFICEMAMQRGFEMLNDDGTVYGCTQEQLIDFTKANRTPAWRPLSEAPDGVRVLLGPREAPVVGIVSQPVPWEENQDPTCHVVHYNGNTLIAAYHCSEWRALDGSAA